MSVSDGQNINAAVTNAAFMSRTGDTDTSGKVDLNNAGPESGSTVENIQRELNSIASFTGKALEAAYDVAPTWASDSIGSPSQHIKARVDSIQAVVETNEASVSDLITLSGVSAGSSDMGTFSGSILSDNSSIKELFQEIEGVFESGSLAGGGSTGLNYIENADAEFNEDGWSTYADAAASEPVDGTGGTANITFARTVAALLRGSAVFGLTKSAANRQGEGVSYDFVVDKVDSLNGSRLNISFEYEISGAGPYANGDITVFLLNKDTSSLVQLYGDNISGYGAQVVGSTADLPKKFFASFYPDYDDDNYRLIFHVASTSASAYQFYFDSVKVSPDTLVPGAIVTELQDFTPSDTSYAWGTASASAFKYRRVGDSIEVHGYLTLSSVVTGDLSFDEAEYLPPGLSVDGNKITTLSVSANWFAIDNSAASDVDEVTGVGTVNTTGGLVLMTGTIATDRVDASQPFTWASGDEIGFYVKVPITGWSSGAMLSTTEGLFSSPKIRVTGDPASATSGNPIIFPTKSWDALNSYNASTGLFTAPKTGYYKIGGFLFTPDTGTISWQAYVNGGFDSWIGKCDSNGEATLSGTVYAQAGQTISLRPNGTVDVATGSYFTIEYIPDFSVFSVYGQYELKTASSSTKTPVATSQYHALTSNSITLTPGTWRLFGKGYFYQSGSAAYSQAFVTWTSANGADSASVPAALSAAVTINSAIESPNYSGVNGLTSASDLRINAPDVIVTATSTQTIYLVSYASMSTPANARVEVYLNAERLR